MLSLEGKVVLITGGYKGIGSVFAKTLSKMQANVVIAARNTAACKYFAKELSDTYHANTTGEFVDVSDKDSVKNLVDSVIRGYGRIDVLVNAAGISGVQRSTIELTKNEFDQIFNRF